MMRNLAPNQSDQSRWKSQPKAIDVTIVMPCLNEAETLAVCIRKALQTRQYNP